MSYVDEVMADAPAAYWRMGEASGLPQDSSGNGRHLTVSSGTRTYGVAGALTGDSDTAITVVRAAQFMTLPAASLSLGDGPFSLECWVKRADLNTASFYWFFGNSPGSGTTRWFVGFNASGALVAWWEGSASWWYTSSQLFEDTNWHHIVLTKSGAARVAYGDGALLTNAAANQTITDYGDWGIGSAGATTSNSFDGTIDEVAVYLSVLSAARVSAHYTAATAPSSPAAGSPIIGGGYYG